MFPYGVQRNETATERSSASSPLLASLPFLDFQRMLSQRSKLLSFDDFCMAGSLHKALHGNNFSGTK